MINSGLNRAEIAAVESLLECESVKIAAMKRGVSEHTQKNQIKSAMYKLDCCTQLGLMKEYLRRYHNTPIEYSAVKRTISFFMILAILFSGCINARYMRSARRRIDIEIATI